MALLKQKDKRKPLFWLAMAAVPFVFLVIILGAFTRLVDAGLGCPDWPTCYGHILWPDEAHEIKAANAQYKETPVETDKTWPEQVHRLLAATLGLISLAVFFLSLRLNKDKKQGSILRSLVLVFLTALILRIVLMTTQMEVTFLAMHDSYDIILAVVMLLGFLFLSWISVRKGPADGGQPIKLPAWIVALVVLQGLFGMWTVTLKVWPQVVTLHLLGGFAMAALFWLLVLRLDNRVWVLPFDQFRQVLSYRRVFWVGFSIVVFQILLGGWTTSNYAAVACPDLPTCQGSMWPQMDFLSGFNIFQSIGPNYLGGIMDNESRVAIHVAHRFGALITAFYVLYVVFLLLFRVDNKTTNPLALIILAVLTLQIGLGVSNILFNFPLFVAIAHNVGGAILLLCMVTLLHRATTVAQER